MTSTPNQSFPQSDLEARLENWPPLVKQDYLTRLGDKLDKAEADTANPDAWVTLYFEYEPLVIKRALSTNIPKVKITNITEYWRVFYLWVAAHDRAKAIDAEIEAGNTDKRSMRRAADLKAQHAVAERDQHIYGEAINVWQDKRKAEKAKAISIAKARRARVRALVKSIIEGAS